MGIGSPGPGSHVFTQTIHWIRQCRPKLLGVPSGALQGWRSQGLARLEELEEVHAAATGTARGRRWGTEQLNRSLFVTLMAQFQSYCRDLHDAAIDVHLGCASTNQRVVLRTLFTQNRKLDSGNPRRSALGSDFGRLGLRLVDDLVARGPLTVVRLDRLDRLVDYRNAIGHGDEGTIASLESTAQIGPTKRWFRTYRSGLDALAGTMDIVVAQRLAALLSVAMPW